MPRTTTLECSGCPPLRALTFDSLGLIKVLEVRDKQRGVPQVVERWGDPESSKCVMAVSMIDRKSQPLLAVARKNNEIEVLSPVNGDIQTTISDGSGLDVRSEENNIVGLHLFGKQNSELDSRSASPVPKGFKALEFLGKLNSYPGYLIELEEGIQFRFCHFLCANVHILNLYCTLLTCTTKGNASIRSIELADSSTESSCIDSPKTWNVCSGGNILCCKVDRHENFALFGGKGVEINIWDINNLTKIWNSKPPPKDNLGIFTPTWFTSAAFLMKDDHRKFVAGTNSHQVRLYDISAQRRPVLSFDFRETPIKALAEDIDGHSVYVGNGSGDMASFDIRTGKMLGGFSGKCSGSIKSIVRHPELPIVASCGERYSVFLKQHVMHVLFDTKFDVKGVDSSLPSKGTTQTEILNEEVEELPLKRKKSSRNEVEDGSERKKKSKHSKERKKSEGKDDERRKSKLKKKNSRSIPEL
ncbi:hypothetical protein V8G54_010841 [Vigna mungo]|uniref:WD repeat-containing protein 74 n=1 Tax=Vigna mungo TaxID=3915 RepID=A0AAQ3S3H9_VIGMU